MYESGMNRDSEWNSAKLKTRDELSYLSSGSPDAAPDNVLIHGDNLVALRLLPKLISTAPRCIYIDPPYNTGSKFEHYDDSVKHDRWLSFLRARLELLFELLAEDGSLWISVDDHEGHYLKVMCDELFGRESFVTTVIWQKKYTQANDAGFFSDNHDFILVYAKDRTRLRMNRLPRSEKQKQAYKNPDSDPRGAWKSTPLHAKSGRAKDFTFTFANGIEWCPPTGTFPRFTKARMQTMDENNEIWFGRNGDAVPSRKTFLKDVRQGVIPKSIWLHDEVGHNHQARVEARSFVPDAPFSTPKPERLLKRIIELGSQPGDIVLDAFAGSGTTGAVAHKMARRWVMIEQGDHCLTHIVPRLKQVIDGTDPGGITDDCQWNGGGSFHGFAIV